jgi:hypothetical protein
MKKTVLFCAIAAISMGFSSPKENCKLNYDGLYFAPLDSTTNAYLKFYADGSILHTTSIEKIEDVSKYFNKTHAKSVLAGSYSFGKCNVSINVFGKTGKMQFSGELENDTLYLKAINNSDHTSDHLKFAFHD